MPDDALMPDNVNVEQLDQAISALLAGAEPQRADPELAALAEVAASLRDLPDERFQKRLKSDLQRRATMSTSTIAPIREGFHTITPYITVPDGVKLIEFLKHTFGAEEVVKHQSPRGFHAEVRMGDSMLMIGSAESVRGQEKTGAFHVYVPDCDATFKRAIEAGAASMGEPSDTVYGERAGFVTDASGNQWYIATHLGATPALHGLWTVTPFVHPTSAAAYIDFLTRALGAQQLALHEHAGRVVYAAVRIGDAVLEMGEPHAALAPARAGFYMYVKDCDDVYGRAIEAGAKSLWPPTDQPFGDRNAGFVDPFGYQWFPATPVKKAR